MTTNEVHINHWLNIANEVLITKNILRKEKRFLPSLYKGAFTTTKHCKVLRFNINNENIPAKFHHLLKILAGSSVLLKEENNKNNL